MNQKPCDYHPGTLIDVDDFKGCPKCVEEYQALRHPDDMTDSEVEAEMNHWRGAMWIPFDLIHRRIELLVGRPVFTNELGLNYDGLIAEAKNRLNPYNDNEQEALQKAMDAIPDDMKGRIIYFGLGEE